MKRPFLEKFFGTVDKICSSPSGGGCRPRQVRETLARCFYLFAVFRHSPSSPQRRAMLGAGGSTMAGQRPPLRWARSEDRAHRRGRVRGRRLPSSGSREIAGCPPPSEREALQGSQGIRHGVKTRKTVCCLSYGHAAVLTAYSAVLFLSSAASSSRSFFTRSSIRWASSGVAFPA